MEELPTVSNPGFAWTDGRRSVWRDIQNTLNFIYQLLEENDDQRVKALEKFIAKKLFKKDYLAVTPLHSLPIMNFFKDKEKKY